jgi:hypothetical protein
VTQLATALAPFLLVKPFRTLVIAAVGCAVHIRLTFAVKRTLEIVGQINCGYVRRFNQIQAHMRHADLLRVLWLSSYCSSNRDSQNPNRSGYEIFVATRSNNSMSSLAVRSMSKAAESAARATPLLQYFSSVQPLPWHNACAHCGRAHPSSAHLSGTRDAQSKVDTDYAFEMATSSIRFGAGSTSEVCKQLAACSALPRVFSDDTVKTLLNTCGIAGRV